MAGWAECCFVIKEFEAEDEAAFREKGRQRRSRRSRRRYNKRKEKELLLDEEFSASTGIPMYVVPPVSRASPSIAPLAPATTMKRPKQEPVLLQL